MVFLVYFGTYDYNYTSFNFHSQARFLYVQLNHETKKLKIWYEAHLRSLHIFQARQLT